MDDAQKAMLKAELQSIRGTIAIAGGMTATFSQMTFPVIGTMVTIPTFTTVAAAIKQQADAMDKLATLVEKVINAS